MTWSPPESRERFGVDVVYPRILLVAQEVPGTLGQSHAVSLVAASLTGDGRNCRTMNSGLPKSTVGVLRTLKKKGICTTWRPP